MKANIPFKVLACLGFLVSFVLMACQSAVPGPNRAPVAVAGADQVIDLGGTATLDCLASHDPDGDTLTCHWSVVATSVVDAAGLSRGQGDTTEITPNAVGVWVVRLLVTDGDLWSGPDVAQVLAKGVACQDDGQCDDDEECTQDRCRNQVCVNSPVEDGTACDDGNYCTTTDTCTAGVCGGTARDCSHVEDACNASSCDEGQERCVLVPRQDGGSCDDGRWCTEGDACVAGACTGSPRDCSASAADCVAGVCDEVADRCVGEPIPDGGLCDDGQFCTEGERCSAGSCQGGQPRDCSATGGGCVDGICDETRDECAGDPLPQGASCNDGLFCTVNDACDGQGSCTGIQRNCGALTNQCNDGTCVEETDRCEAEPANQGQPCDDGLYCSVSEMCQSGACAGGGARNCDDDDPCTLDGCDEANDSCDNVLQPNPGAEGPHGDATCGDGSDNDCDQLTDTSDPQCQECQNDIDCDDGNPCTVNSCNSPSCVTTNVGDGAPCDDGLFCSEPDTCTSGVCTGPPRDCGQLTDPCNQGVCDEVGDQCTAQPVNEGLGCDDGDFCNVDETCQSGTCTGGGSRDCSGVADQCNTGACDGGAQQCIQQPANQGASCDDGDFCNTGETCQSGSCTGGQPRDCDFISDACNDGVCDEVADACVLAPKPQGEPCEDGLFCTDGDTCDVAGACLAGPDTPCTTECRTVCNETGNRCDADGSGTPCSDDLQFCNGTEACDGAGGCSHSGNPCAGGGECNQACDDTDDDCFNPSGTPCTDDLLFCTGAETCDGNGHCVSSGDPCSAGEFCDDIADACLGCVVDADCPVCQWCDAGDCELQVLGDDDKNECDPDDCNTGDCDGAGVCGVMSASFPCRGTTPSYCDSTCDGAGGCAEPAPVDCSHLDGECMRGACVPADGSCVQQNASPGDPCDDGDTCSSADLCDDTGACRSGATDLDADGDNFYDDACLGGDDCDDGDASIHPGVIEGPSGAAICTDGVDNDCDGDTDAADHGCGDWWNADWGWRRKLTFDNSGQAQPLDDFPVLVALTDPDRIEYDSTQDQGEDIRFVDADGTTVLCHEIERWDESITSYVWVKVPRIDASSGADYIWMYYGNDMAPDGQDPPGVWTNHYEAVYHLHADLNDSTVHGYDGTNHGVVGTAAVIAWGRDFEDSQADWIELSGDLPLLRNVDGATLSAWVRPESIGLANYLISFSVNSGSPTSASRATLGVGYTDEFVVGGRAADTETFRELSSNSNPISAGGLYFIAGVIDYAGGDLTLYLNGNFERSSSPGFAQGATSDTNASYNALGTQDDASDYYFDGIADEIRVSDTVRSAAWIRAQYLSTSDSGFVIYGSEEP